jgi:predicted nucleotidyltransferase
VSGGPEPLDFSRLLSALGDERVEFVVIGGVAAIAHGARRTTLDLDIVPRPLHENYVRLAAALERLGVKGRIDDGEFQSLDPLDPVDLARSRNMSLPTSAGQLDVLNRTLGSPSFDELVKRGRALSIAGIPVIVVGIDDLIAMKLAAGRPRDLQDVADMTASEVADES